ncbi:MAG: AAA family ATPase, partial [Sarcina sp.]
MNYRETLKAVQLVLDMAEVPLIIGDAGIGKTALVKDLSKNNNLELVTIDGNLLKEGEIGGLPVVEKRMVNGKERTITVYATHSKLNEVDDAILDGKKVLLFIDELNRCEHAVQQELMNLILNREINGYKLTDEVKVVAAMNPSNKYEDYENSNYDVVDMDEAQEDRFVWINMEADIKAWMKWAMEDGNISAVVIEFLSTFPEYLNRPDTREAVIATPRSWERVSKAYNIYVNSESYSEDVFYNVLKGNIGATVAQDFVAYINNIENPLIKAEEIFKKEVLSFDIKEIIERENHSRLYILAKSSLNYIERNEGKENNIEIFSEMLKIYPKDLALAIMKEIKSEYKEKLYGLFIEN